MMMPNIPTNLKIALMMIVKMKMMMLMNLVSKVLNKFMKNILEVKRNKRWIPPRKLKVLRGKNKQEKQNQN